MWMWNKYWRRSSDIGSHKCTSSDCHLFRSPNAVHLVLLFQPHSKNGHCRFHYTVAMSGRGLCVNEMRWAIALLHNEQFIDHHYCRNDQLHSSIICYYKWKELLALRAKKKNHYVLTHSFGTRSETNIETERDNKHETHICKVDKLREKYAEQFVHLASSCGFSLPLLLVVYVFRRLLIRTRSFQRRTEWMELLGEAILVWQSRAFVACTNTATASSWLAFQRFRLRWGFSSAYHSNARRSPISLCIVFQFHYKQK